MKRLGGLPSSFLPLNWNVAMKFGRGFGMLFLALVALGSAASAKETSPLVADHFESETHATRNAARGDWTIADGIAAVAHDDELYKKYANHGPIINYEIPFDDASVAIEFKANDCKTVVFTMDGAEGGHAFRIIMRPPPTGDKPNAAKSMVVTYTEKVGEDKPKMIPLSREVPALDNNQWTRLEVRLVGDKVDVAVNGKTISVQHERLNQKKRIAKIGFSFGDFAIRKFELDAI